MKKALFLFLAVSFPPWVQAQPPLTAEQRQVQQAVVQLFDALSNRDSASLRAHCTPDITLHEYGQVWTLDTLLRKAITLNTALDFNRSNAFEFIRTESDGNTAWATYRLVSKITNAGKQLTLRWLETVVLVRQKKQWKVRHLHSTLLRKD